MLLPRRITVIKMCVLTSRFANVLCQIRQTGVIFTHLKLWVAVARHNFRFYFILLGFIFLICFINCLNRSYWERNACLYIKICKCFIFLKINMSNFHPLKVVGRGSDTQLQVGENLNYCRIVPLCRTISSAPIHYI